MKHCLNKDVDMVLAELLSAEDENFEEAHKMIEDVYREKNDILEEMETLNQQTSSNKGTAYKYKQATE